MIGEGDPAPDFSLPAVEDGEVGEVALADYLGEDIVILAFYPADFNPCCDGESTDLDELDLFTMQKDVSILGISGDSVYSHRAFAETYDLKVPLLADVDSEVAAAYGVAAPDAEGYRTNRAVVVIDPDGDVQYAWQTDDIERVPPVESVREAVEGIGGGRVAEARYRVGHAHYVEGRRAFTKAMGGFEEMEWMMAQGDFTRAREEFEEASDQFNTAVRFGEREASLQHFERAERKADALAQAAKWLSDAARAYASGEGAEGKEMRTDAERPLETAKDIDEPPDPDDFPPDGDPARTGDEPESVLPSEDDGPPPGLDADIDGAVASEADTGLTGDASTEANRATADAGNSSGGEQIDDEELEEIAAELEAQTEAAQAEREDSDESAGAVSDDPSDGQAGTHDAASDSDPMADEALDEDGTLDLADPTEGQADDAETDDDESEDEDDESDWTDTDDLSGGDHGVPDSL